MSNATSSKPNKHYHNNHTILAILTISYNILYNAIYLPHHYIRSILIKLIKGQQSLSKDDHVQTLLNSLVGKGEAFG